MTLEEIKQAVDKGLTVMRSHSSYTVIKDRDNYYLTCIYNHYTTSLTHKDHLTLNGKESDFYILN